MAASPDDDAALRGLRAGYFDEVEPLEREAARQAVARLLFADAGPPTRLGRYELRRGIGAGGMGTVFEAYDPELDREVAVKVLRVGASRAGASLLEEARAVARVVHPNVVTVFDAGLSEDRVFVAMQLVDGTSLRHWLRKPRRAEAVCAVLAKAARGVAAAHEAGVLHRDLKPDNILIAKSGQPLVADFGLSLGLDGPDGTVRAGTVAGTPAYMAPEQFLDAPQDARTDQWSFVVTLFEALLGRLPFEGTTTDEIRRAVLSGPPRMPVAAQSLPHPVLSILERGLARDRRDRFPSMDVLADTLEDAAGEIQRLSALPASIFPSASALQGYLSTLPSGLDSYPEVTTESVFVRLAVPREAIDDVPDGLVPVALAAWRGATLTLVHAAALLIARYESGPDATLYDWQERAGGVARAMTRLAFAGFGLGRPSASTFVETIVAALNRRLGGFALRCADEGIRTARFAMDHPPHAMHPVPAAALAEVLRAMLLEAGCAMADVRLLGVEAETTWFEGRWQGEGGRA